jgi:hypothetical protein
MKNSSRCIEVKERSWLHDLGEVRGLGEQTAVMVEQGKEQWEGAIGAFARPIHHTRLIANTGTTKFPLFTNLH